MQAAPAFSSAADSSLVTYTWKITEGDSYASISSSKNTATVTGKNTTAQTQSATVFVTATYNGASKSAAQTISIAAASPDNPDNPDTPAAESKITITYSSSHGTAPASKSYDKTDSGYTLTADDLPALTETGYIFGGWSKTEVVSTASTGSGQAGSAIADTGSTTTVKVGDTITENTTLYAIWTAITYTVKFDANGGSGEAVSEISVAYDVEFEVPENSFTFEGYNASANTWNTSSDASGATLIAGSKAKNLTAEDRATVTLYAIWIEKGAHSIIYLDSDGTTAISGMSPVTFKETEDVDLSKAVPEKAGYTFAGWAVSAGSTSPDAGSTTPDAGSTTATISGWKAGEKTSDVVLYAVWTANANTAYTVKHYLQNVALTDYEEQTSDEESLTGTTGEITAAEAKTYPGFTAKEITQGTIAADGSTVVSVYYDRNTVTLTFDSDGGSYIASITGKYGTAVAEPEEPAKEGQIFSYWEPWFPETFPETDTTYTAHWGWPSDATPYKVRHLISRLDGEGFELYEEETLTGKTGEQTQAVAKNIEGFTPLSGIFQFIIYSDGSTITSVYYSRNYVTLYFDSNGGSKVESVSGKYGAAVKAPENPTKDGCTFLGWSSEVPTTFPAESTSYTAQWDDGFRSYKVRHFKELLDGGYELSEEETLTGKAGEQTQAAVNRYEGFSPQEIMQETIAEDGSTIVSVYYDRDTFTLSINLNDGSEIASVSGKYGAPVPEIEIPSKKGYTFAGWFFLNGTFTVSVAKLPDTFPAYNRTYTATWTGNTDTKYTVKHYKQNLEDDEYTLADTEVLTGTTGSWVPTVSEKTYEGFYTSRNDGAYQKIAGDGSTVVSVYYNRNIIIFTLNLDGGSGIKMAFGKYGAAVTAPSNPSKEGYIFAGWNTAGGTLAPIFEKDTTYTAVWTWSRVEGISVTVENQDDITVTRESAEKTLIFTAEECDSYAWYLDDEKKGSDKTYSLDTSSFAAGTYTLALEAEKNGKWYSYFAQIKVSK